MAQGNKRKTNRAGDAKKAPQKKKSFWAHFFEPIPDAEETDPATANRQYGEPPESALVHLFGDDEVEYSDEQDKEALAGLTWEDGEKVVSNVPGAAETKEPIRLFDDGEDGDDQAGAHSFDTTRTRIFRTGTSATARISINATEESQRYEEAQKKARAREAQRQHEAYVERKNRKKKRMASAKKVFGNVAFVLFLVAAILVALYYGFLLSDIVVLGNETYSAEHIIELSGLQLGKHILACDLDAAQAGVEENPYLQVESITYIFPSRIRIIVTERKEAAGIIGLDYNVIIDKNGYVLSMSGGTDLSKLLQVTGVTMTGFQLGQRLGQGNDLTTATLVDIIAKLEEYALISSIKSIDMTTPLALTMTAQNGLKIQLGQATDLDAKMSSLYRLLPQFVSKNVTTGTLYLSAKGGTVYSPSDAAERALQGVTDAGADTAQLPNENDLDGDGYDDVTGEAIVTPEPATVTPQPSAVTPAPGGSGDDFSG